MTPSKRARFGVLLLLSGAWSLQYFAACDSVDNGGTGPSTTGGGTTSIGTTAATPGTTGGPTSEDLFECFQPSCAPVCFHIAYWGECGGDLACAEGVWSSGESGGVVVSEFISAFGLSQEQTLFVLFGDGQVLTQRRTRACPTGTGESGCDIEPIPWELHIQLLCEMGAKFPERSEEPCVRVDYSCDDAGELVEGAGEAGHAGEASE